MEKQMPTIEDVYEERYGKIIRTLQAQVENAIEDFGNKTWKDFDCKELIRNALLMDDLLIEWERVGNYNGG